MAVPACSPSGSAAFRRLLEPAFAAYEDSAARYRRTELGDHDFIEMGVSRALRESSTGSDLLQRHSTPTTAATRSAPASSPRPLDGKRRPANLGPVNTALAAEMGRRRENPLAAVPGLGNFAPNAGDGHFHSAATHDPKLEGSGSCLRKSAGPFFTLDLRRFTDEDAATGRTFTYFTTEMTMLETAIGRESGVHHKREIERRMERAHAALENGASSAATSIQRVAVRRLKFGRWLRNHIYKAASWVEAVAPLHLDYASTLYPPFHIVAAVRSRADSGSDGGCRIEDHDT